MSGHIAHREQFCKRIARRIGRGLLIVLATTGVGLAAAWSQTAPPKPPDRSEQSLHTTNRGQSVSKATRQREGTELKSEKGYFRVVDGRTVFFPSDGEFRYTVLENLNLERIVVEITRNPSQLEWAVAGVVTEFKGSNYLLVQRAVLSRSSSGASTPL